MVEILKQPQFEPLSMAREVLMIYVGTNGYLDDLPITAVKKFEAEFYAYIEKVYPDLEHEVEMKKELTPALIQKLEKAIGEFKKTFKS